MSIGIKEDSLSQSTGQGTNHINVFRDGLSSTFPVVQVKALTLNDCNSVPEMAAPWIFTEHMLSGLSDEICKCFLLSAPSLTSKAQKLRGSEEVFPSLCVLSASDRCSHEEDSPV